MRQKKNRWINGEEQMDDIVIQIQNGIYKGDTKYVIDRTELALRYGISLDEIMKEALFLPMQVLGEKLRTHELFIPDVLKASRAMHAALYVLRPIISHSSGAPKGLVVIGTVAGDLHDIGKNMVSMMLTGHGYTVVDLGIDVTKEQFAEAIVKYQPDVLGLSALLTTTMPEMQNVIEYLQEMNLRDQVVSLEKTSLDKSVPVKMLSVQKTAERNFGNRTARVMKKPFYTGISKKRSCVFESWSTETTMEYSENRLHEIIDAFEHNNRYGTIVRAKGILNYTQGSLLLDYVPGEGRISSIDQEETGQMVVIGVNLNYRALERLFLTYA